MRVSFESSHHSFWVARWISSLIIDKVPLPPIPTTLNQRGYPCPRHSILCSTERVQYPASPSSFSLPPYLSTFLLFSFSFFFFPFFFCIIPCALPGSPGVCHPVLPLSLSLSLGTPLFLRSPSMRRGQIYEGRGWRTSTYIYIFIRVSAACLCVCTRACVLEEGWGGKRRNRRRELCVELIRASLKVSRSKFPPPTSSFLLPQPLRFRLARYNAVVVGPARVSRLEIATRSAKYHGKDANEPFGNRATNRSAAN